MALAFNWASQYFYYPIGNTAAVCLTRDLPREEPATMLLLGCGDTRNVLFTIFNEQTDARRQLDFTCVDHEPAVFARNILLLTMIFDGQPFDTLWNMYYHMFLDKSSHSALIEQCKKLLEVSSTPQQWRDSSYGSFLRFSTEYTLSEVRRHWQLYVDSVTLPRNRIKTIREEFKGVFKDNIVGGGTTVTTARSSGPTLSVAINPTAAQSKRYWRTGLTFSNPKLVQEATFINPTYLYSLGGDTCSVHCATDPIASFHLAPLFGNAKGKVPVDDVVRAARDEFRQWCDTFKEVVSSDTVPSPVIRMFVGEATVVCRALRSFASFGVLDPGIPVGQWKTQLIKLDEEEFRTAPTSFNVIETSNLVDYIGLLNILIGATPLLSMASSSSVMYTESLLFKSEEATKEFTERLHANITTLGHLLGLCPVDYLAGYGSRSNTHEISLHRNTQSYGFQYHQTTTWKVPSSADTIAIADRVGNRPMKFQMQQLGTLLYDIYLSLFIQEDAEKFWNMNQKNLARAIGQANNTKYTRESFVLLSKLVRDRHQISTSDWEEVQERFNDHKVADTTNSMEGNNSHDLWGQLHYHGVWTIPYYRAQAFAPRFQRFSKWTSMPVTVRIILVVPREKLTVLDESVDKVGTPMMRCDVNASRTHALFSAIHVVYGRVIPIGTEAEPRVRIEQDPDGKRGKMPLLVSFVMPSMILTTLEPQADLNIGFSVRNSMSTVQLVTKLGPLLRVHVAPFLDKDQVHVLPESDFHARPHPAPKPSLQKTHGVLSQIGTTGDVAVELDSECELVQCLISRITIQNERVKQSFGTEGAIPTVSQVSSCTMRIAVGDHGQDVCFPFPVIGSANRLRLARKSLYIEVIVPPYGPLKNDGMRLNPYPVTRSSARDLLNSWSIHHVNLSRLPVLDVRAKDLDSWLAPHYSCMMSHREQALRKTHEDDNIMLIKDTIHTLLARSSGILAELGPPRKLFTLVDKNTKLTDTIFFVNDIKYDLQAHTMVCDAYVLTLTKEVKSSRGHEVVKLHKEGKCQDITVFGREMEVWKQLQPALVERCRTWAHGDNCEYKSQGSIPLTQEKEADPLCSCGRGKDVSGMQKDKLWKPFARHVTRIALSPLFAVSYLENIVRDIALRRCYVCRGKGKPKLQECTGCKKVRYCSKECQKKDWATHKKACKA